MLPRVSAAKRAVAELSVLESTAAFAWETAKGVVMGSDTALQ
jgi:hypothetical protein